VNLQQAGQALRARTVSSVELTRDSLQRITQVDSKLKAFITVMAESAEAQAREADARFAAGTDLGPLQGIPVAVKDVFCTAGVRTTCGSKLFADYVPEQDSAVVERLRSAGAVLLGKTNMHELAYGVTSSNPHYGAVRNPWDCDRVAGGSSGGSGSAVARALPSFSEIERAIAASVVTWPDAPWSIPPWPGSIMMVPSTGFCCAHALFAANMKILATKKLLKQRYNFFLFIYSSRI